MEKKSSKVDIGNFIISTLVCFSIFGAVIYGHGGTSEIFPPTSIDGRQVTLEVAAQNEPDLGQQIHISFLDFDSKITLRDVTFNIKAERGNQYLFEREFVSENGILIFDFISEKTPITLEELEGDFFGSLLGLDNKSIEVKGEKLGDGGLYKFNVSILGFNKSKLDVPLVYDTGISIPQTTSHKISHNNYGNQIIQTITYYDELSKFQYNNKEISFFMPFEWTKYNIEKTSVVHQELIIPKSFGELLVSDFSMYVNDIKLSDDIITIDDFAPDIRTVHFIINQQELQRISEKNNQDGMNFVIKPTLEKSQLSAITQNGQFKILVTWEPDVIKSGSDVVISFDVIDVFLRDKQASVNYNFSIIHDGLVIYEQNGTSTESKEYDVIKLAIPDGINGIINITFELDGNDRATASFPVIVNDILIPSWVKESAGWWVSGVIDDDTFVKSIEFLIQNDIISISNITQSDLTSDVPSWVKESAGWWVSGVIDDDTFVKSLEFLIEKGVIQIRSNV